MIHIEDKVVLRKEDVDECALGGMTPEQALLMSVKGSTHSYRMFKDGELLAYWGWRDGSVISGNCRAWMLSTPAIENYRMYAARKSREIINELLFDHYSVTVIVDPSYTTSVRWLHWLGFKRIGVFDRFDEMQITRGSRA